ncbi:hypothetical protein PV326_013052 [Microctonus aethiopoides]|nr:hypothetical protein PV326_013052 [Microctonus aethiopoides]
MVTLQAPNLQKNDSEQCDYHEKTSFTNDEEKKIVSLSNSNTEFVSGFNKSYANCLILDSSTLPTVRSNIDDNYSAHCSSVDDGSINNTEIFEIEDNIEDETENEDEMEGEIIPNRLKWMEKIQHETPNGQILPSLDNTNYGEVCVTNSTNVRVGNTMLYKGPVTIKQFVYTNSDSTKQSSDANGRLSDNNINCTSIGNASPVYQEYDKVKKWLWTWRCAAILCILGLILITVVVVIIVMLTKHSEFFPNFAPAIDPDDILTDNVRFIQRVEWGAQPPEEPPKKLTITPAPYVIISHTASESCNNQAECIQRVRLAQTMHIEGNHWSDIGYNFLVGGDGLIYVGRGWDNEGAHAFGFNIKSIGICLIGTFNKIVPPTRQLDTLAKLIAIGVKNKKIQTDYKLLGHRQVSETLSPGNVLYSIIQQWDHWSPKP